MVRSEEKKEDPPVDMMLMRVHLAWSLYVSSTLACAAQMRKSIRSDVALESMTTGGICPSRGPFHVR